MKLKIITLLLGMFWVSSFAFSNVNDLENIVDNNKILRVGVGYMAPPMNYLDDSGNHVGFDVDLAIIIAKKMGYDYELIKVNNKTRVGFLASGKVDLVISSMNHTLGRDKVIDFSEPYLRDGKRILAKKGRFKSLNDLVGKRIAVVQGSNAGTAIKMELKKLGDSNPKIKSFQNNAECFLALKTGKVDGYTNDTVIMLGVSGGDKSYEVVGDIYSPTYFSMGVPEGQSNWRDKVNFTLREIYLDGTYDEIYNKWFGTKAKYTLPKTNHGPDIWPE